MSINANANDPGAIYPRYDPVSGSICKGISELLRQDICQKRKAAFTIVISQLVDRNSAIEVLPLTCASSNGVLPSLFAIFLSAPYLIKSFTAYNLFPKIAQ